MMFTYRHACLYMYIVHRVDYDTDMHAHVYGSRYGFNSLTRRSFEPRCRFTYRSKHDWIFHSALCLEFKTQLGYADVLCKRSYLKTSVCSHAHVFIQILIRILYVSEYSPRFGDISSTVDDIFQNDYITNFSLFLLVLFSLLKMLRSISDIFISKVKSLQIQTLSRNEWQLIIGHFIITPESR